VISEKSLATEHPNFWWIVMPRSEQMTRVLNSSRRSFSKPIASEVGSENRGLINELATRLCQQAIAHESSVKKLASDIVEKSIDAAHHFIFRFRESTSGAVDSVLSDEEVKESKAIAERLRKVLADEYPDAQMFVPIVGAGIVDDCVADGVGSECVIEVKAGDRPFRSVDIRQALVYAALLHLTSPHESPERVAVVNPRMGWIVNEPISRLLELSGGRTWSYFIAEFENYVCNAGHMHISPEVSIQQEVRSSRIEK